MIIEVTHNKFKWGKALRKLNIDHKLSALVPPIGSNYGAWWFVAIERGNLVGAAACEHCTENHNEIFLGPCAVIPSARGRGLQKKFIERREVKGLELGFNTFVSKIHYDNIYSLKNFIQSGYQEYDREGDFICFKHVIQLTP